VNVILGLLGLNLLQVDSAGQGDQAFQVDQIDPIAQFLKMGKPHQNLGLLQEE
jgi:hypothetical protein